MVWLLDCSGNEASRAQQVFDLFMLLTSPYKPLFLAAWRS
jgi:hypothetical protein